MKILHLPFYTYPQTEPELGKPIVAYFDDNCTGSAPFRLQKTPGGYPVLIMFGSSTLSIPLTSVSTFDWVYLSDIKPTLLN